jgi:hypothetical protein
VDAVTGESFAPSLACYQADIRLGQAHMVGVVRVEGSEM